MTVFFSFIQLYAEQRGINSMYNSELARTTPRPQSSSVMRIDVKEKNSETPETKPETEIDRRKSANRNRSAIDNGRLPSATGRAPPNRLPPINKNQNNSNF